MNTSVETSFSLKGKIALVTGASRGIGQTIASGLVAAGATVYGIGRTDPTVLQGLDFQYVSANVNNLNSLNVVRDLILKSHSYLDILVNAAGTTFPVSESYSVEQKTDIFDQTLQANTVGAYRAIEVFVPLLKKSGNGSIINITSIGAEFGFPNNPAYTASKAGLKLMSKSLAIDLSPFHIRVNCIAPGYIHTAMTTQSFNDPVKHAQRLNHMILPRWGDPSDLVGPVIFLASDASSYVTGIDLAVDGGWAAKGMT